MGEKYRYIMEKCYYFDKRKRTITNGQKKCNSTFGEGVNGKLFEPTSAEVFHEIKVEAAKIIGTAKQIHTGFMKLDDSGKTIVHSSTGKHWPT